MPIADTWLMLRFYGLFRDPLATNHMSGLHAIDAFDHQSCKPDAVAKPVHKCISLHAERCSFATHCMMVCHNHYQRLVPYLVYGWRVCCTYPINQGHTYKIVPFWYMHCAYAI